MISLIIIEADIARQIRYCPARRLHPVPFAVTAGPKRKHTFFRVKHMNSANKYYEELYFIHQDSRSLLPQNQAAIVELLDKNGAVGVIAFYDEPGYPIYFVSGFALTALDYERSEMLRACDEQFLNLVYEKDRQAFTENTQNKNLVCQEFRLVNSSGKNIWVNSYQKPCLSMDGRPIIIASIRIVEDARKRESELLTALTKGYNRIIYVDMNQGRYRVIKSDGGVFDEQICGTLSELEELLRRYRQDYINPEDHSFADILNKLNFFSVSADQGGNYQTTYLAKTGDDYQWVEFQAFYGGAMNLDTGHVILTFRVVDEEKRRELDAKRILSDSLAKAEEAGRIKNKFLSRMSHDLRTPINGITGMLEIAKKNRTNPEKIDECISKIAVACDHLMSLVTDVLDMNTFENGDLCLTDEAIRLDTLLAKDLRPILARAKERGLTYTAQIEPFAHPGIIGSPKHILQIFHHVLDNAIKYNKPNGSITLTAREISDNHSVAVFEFRITDTGIGMEPKFASLVFEAFEQEHNEARTDYIGTGLGMSIVKILVTHMNGTISLESTPGVGTTVSITLPFKVDTALSDADAAPDAQNAALSETAALAADESDASASGKTTDFTPSFTSYVSFDKTTDDAGAESGEYGRLSTCRALLVEDNEINMEITRFLLEDAGMSVVCAENGQLALTQFEQSSPNEFDFILMDIMMPVMDGLEAARRLRALPRPDAATVPIIALSANVMDDDIKKTKMAGMNEHLPKPINSRQLLDTIAKCLHRV